MHFRGPVINYREGATNREVGGSEVLPLHKGGGAEHF